MNIKIVLKKSLLSRDKEATTRENRSSEFLTRPRGYKTFFMLNSAELKILAAHY